MPDSLDLLLEVNRKHIYALRDAIKEELSGAKCANCPESDERVLDFDHVTGVKLFPISMAIRKMVSLQELRLEMAKCIIRCRNCHLKRHDYSGRGEHYYTSDAAIEGHLAKTERAVIKAYLRDVAKEKTRREQM